MNKLYLLIAILFVLLTSNANAATTFYGNFNDTGTTCGFNTTAWPNNLASGTGITWNATSINGKCVGYYERDPLVPSVAHSAKTACSPLLNVTPNFVLTYWVYASSVQAFDINNPEVWLSIWDSNNTPMRNAVDVGNTASPNGNQTMIKGGPAAGTGGTIAHIFNGSQVGSVDAGQLTYDRWHNVTVHKLANGTMRLFFDEVLQLAATSNSSIEKNNTYLCLGAHKGKTVLFSNVTLTDGAGIASTDINTTRQEYLEYENATISASVVGATVGDNLTFSYTIWYQNGTGELMQRYTYLAPSSNFTYTNVVNLGNNTNRTETRKISLFVNSTTSQLFNYTYANVSVTVYKPTLDNCTLTNTPTINVTILQEGTFGPAYNFTVEFNGNITPPVTGRYYSFGLQKNFTNTNNGTICIFPSWANYTLKDHFTYYAPSYSTRNYYLSTQLTNISTPVTFYALLATDSSEVDITLKDSLSNLVPNYVINAQRYFVNLNAYLTVAQGLTDDSGRTNVFIYQPAGTYVFLVTTREGAIVGRFTQVIDSSIQTGTDANGNGIYALTLNLGQGSSNIYKQFGSTTATCSFSNQTTVLSCTVADQTGAAASSQLDVANMTRLGWSTVCTSQATGSSATLVCQIGNGWNTSIYSYNLLLRNNDGSYTTAYTGTLDFTTNSLRTSWGTTGFVGTMFIVLMAFGIGIFSPAAALVMSGIGLVASFAFGLLDIGIGSLVGFLCIIALIIWKSRG